MDLQEHVIEERTPLGNNGFRRMSGLTGYREALYPDNGFIIQEVDHCPLPQAEKLLLPVFAGVTMPTECLECSECRKTVHSFNVSCARTFGLRFNKVIQDAPPITLKRFTHWMLATRKWPCTGCEQSCGEALKQMVDAIELVTGKRVETFDPRKIYGEVSHSLGG